jgi:hypothetical protein
MATPSRVEIENQLCYAIKPLNELRKLCGTHSYSGSGSYKSVDVQSNYLLMEDDLVQNLEGDFVREKMDSLLNFRALLDTALSAAPGVIYPHLREYMKFAGYPETDAQAMCTRLYDYMAANSLTVQNRGFTLGTPAAQTGIVGNGTINRCTTDENGYVIESQTGAVSPGVTKWAECVADEHSGANEHEEQYYFFGDTPDRDRLKIRGVADRQTIKALSAVDSMRFIQNPSFESHSGTDASAFSAVTDLTGWTLSTAASFTPVIANYYRDYQGCSTPRALQINANASVYQNLSSIRAKINPYIPMYLQIAYNRSVGSADGTLTLTLGSQTVNVTLSAQSGWNVLRLAVGQDNWFRHWNQEDPLVKIEWSARTTGTLLVDDIVFAPYSLFDGAWYAVVGGSTPFLRRDKFKWADTIASTEGVIQYWFYRAFGRYLPGAATGETWPDP